MTISGLFGYIIAVILRSSEIQTQVGIIGAGPAGLTLAHILHLAGIDSIVLEDHTRDYVESRVRAGVLEQNPVNLFRNLGLSERLDVEGLEHRGIELRFQGESHRVAFDKLVDRSIWVYGQQEVVKDLIAARMGTGKPIFFGAKALSVEGVTGKSPVIRYEYENETHELECDFVIGCDGFHGVSRSQIPQSMLSEYIHDYPYGWVGLLAAVPPSTEELIYAAHDSGFALHSLRSPELSRIYVQCASDDVIENWPDRRIWDEMHKRFEYTGWSLKEGPVIEKGITPMRSYVAEPMQYGRLFLAGDAAHIVPPTGAKGLNLAIADVHVLSQGLIEYFDSGSKVVLASYSQKCLSRVWKVMHFSWWMTQLLHIAPHDQDGTHRRLQLAHLEYLTASEAALTSLAEQYTGMQL